jgi:D-aspartate ligase
VALGGRAVGMNTSVPVVVFSCGFPGLGIHKTIHRGYGGLGVARSLGRLGVPVYLIMEKGLWPVSSSRYWKGTFTWNLSASIDESLSFLSEVRRRVGSRPILLTTTDRAAAFVADNADALEETFLFPRVSPAVLRLLTDKSEMVRIAKANYIPAPETSFPQSKDALVKFLEGARFPIMLKGANPLLPYGTIKEIINDPKDLFEKFDRAVAAGSPNLILQEYIPGGDDAVWMCNGYFDKDSECLATFTGRKLRQWPLHAGVASLAVCEPNETVANSTRCFMKAVGYQGLVGIGYRYDARDGLYKILDVNPRVSGVFRLFVTENGMDIVRVAYLGLTRQEIPPLALSPGRKWMMEEDLLSAFRSATEGKLTFKQWVASLRGVQERLWFARDDAMPFLIWCWRRLANAVLNIVGFRRS